MYLKQQYLHKVALTELDSSIPSIIRIFQYTEKILDNSSNIQAKNDYGELGNYNYPFAIKFPFSNNSIDGFTELRNIVFNNRFPSISKKYLFEKFYIFELPDFGAQSMSSGFLDFIPLCFSNGYKIPQKYIGILKSYTQKISYILIPKSSATINEIDIIIQFKSYDYFTGNSKNDILKSGIEIKSGETISLKGLSKAQFEFLNSEFQFELVEKNSVKVLDLSDYNIKINYSKNNDTAVSRQTDDTTPDSENNIKKYDYFKQIFDKEYLIFKNQYAISELINETYDIDITVNILATTTDSYILVPRSILQPYYNLKSGQLSYNNMYCLFDAPLLKRNNFMIFLSNSKNNYYKTKNLNTYFDNKYIVVLDIQQTSNIDGELIPFFDTKRSLFMNFKVKESDKKLINVLSYFKSKKIYKWNIDISLSDIFVFKNSKLLIKNIDYIISDNKIELIDFPQIDDEFEIILRHENYFVDKETNESSDDLDTTDIGDILVSSKQFKYDNISYYSGDPELVDFEYSDDKKNLEIESVVSLYDKNDEEILELLDKDEPVFYKDDNGINIGYEITSDSITKIEKELLNGIEEYEYFKGSDNYEKYNSFQSDFGNIEKNLQISGINLMGNLIYSYDILNLVERRSLLNDKLGGFNKLLKEIGSSLKPGFVLLNDKTISSDESYFCYLFIISNDTPNLTENEPPIDIQFQDSNEEIITMIYHPKFMTFYGNGNNKNPLIYDSSSIKYTTDDYKNPLRIFTYFPGDIFENKEFKIKPISASNVLIIGVK